MKKMFIMLFALWTLNGASAQPCLPEGITFTTQAQINSFQVNYPGCCQIGGTVVINGYNITNLLGLSVLTAIGGDLDIVNNAVLTSLSGLDGLAYVGGHFHCVENPLLTSLSGLDNLVRIGGEFHCIENLSLASLSGMENLVHLGGEIVLTNNLALTSLDALHGLTGIKGILWIDFNDALVNLEGLNNVESIAGDVNIHSNASLGSFAGLEGLTSIAGELVIGGYGHLGSMGNPALASISSLMNLASVGGDISIGYNTSLTSLSGLDNIEAGSVAGLSIFNNDNLSRCDVVSICNYLVSPGGLVDISNNATGCSSPEEVLAACAASSETLRDRPPVSVYPNPAFDHVIIELPAVPVQCHLAIASIFGKVMVEKQLLEPRTLIDMGTLSAGMYFIRLKGNDMDTSQILIRQ